MILHLDMDAFFASVEQLDNPDLRGKPVIIGGGDRGVVSTASYEARRYGIHSAMPMASARKLCPSGVFIHGRYSRYSEVSRKIMACLLQYTDRVQPASIDEAYMDLAEIERVGNDPLDVAMRVKNDIKVAAGLTCSIGVAPVKFLAKICSDINKPDGICVIREDDVESLLPDLPIEALPGVGAAMKSSLRSFGVYTVGQARSLSRQFLWERYGKFGILLHDRARGVDPRPVRPNPPAKSEGREHTFARDIISRQILKEKLRELSEKVSASLMKGGFAGRTITLKIKFSDFRQITRSHTLETPVNAAGTIAAVASKILDKVKMPQPARLIGVCVSGFESRDQQFYLPGVNYAPDIFGGAAERE
ncbi:MAG: DNA polymerase IV [Desulfovibrio sp.]|nr:DNA polymerase IV [Desulfovibrio sp.]